MGYARILVEREAVLGAFNFYSEMRQGTNLSQHRIDAFYQLENNIQLGFTGLFRAAFGNGERARRSKNTLKRVAV